jgi:hypothetical protein
MIPFFSLLLLDAGAEESSLTLGDYRIGGSIEAGWRLTDIDGRDRYKEVVNLFDGPRLFDFNFWARPLNRQGPFDFFNVSAGGIGDPFPFVRFQVKKDRLYDLSGVYREYRWSFNREDDDIFTDNHDFHQTRRMGSVNFGLVPWDGARMNVGYSRWERDGDALAPRPFFIFQRQELNEALDQVFVSADFPIRSWDFHIKQSFWSYRNHNEIDGPFQIEGRDERVNTYVNTVKAHTRLTDRMDFDAGYIYAHSWGEAELFTSPIIMVNGGDSSFGFDTHVGELGLSYLILPQLIAHVDYRVHTIRQAGTSSTDDPVGTGDLNADYNLWAHTGTFQLEYLPRDNLTVRAGYRVQYRSVDTDGVGLSDFPGGNDPLHTRIVTHGWVGSVDWKPWKCLGFFGEYQGADFSNPYTWISPESENLAKARVTYRTPIEDLTLRGTFLWRRKRNPDQEFRVDTKDYIFSANYQPKFAPGLSMDASVTYEKIQDKKDFVLEPGFPFSPFARRFSFDSDALIYSGGVTYEGIYKGLGARLAGSYAQTRGENDERLADSEFSIWYKNPYVTPIVSLRRTYLVDHENRQDGFDANMVTFSLRKEF